MNPKTNQAFLSALHTRRARIFLRIGHVWSWCSTCEFTFKSLAFNFFSIQSYPFECVMDKIFRRNNQHKFYKYSTLINNQLTKHLISPAYCNVRKFYFCCINIYTCRNDPHLYPAEMSIAPRKHQHVSVHTLSKKASINMLRKS